MQRTSSHWHHPAARQRHASAPPPRRETGAWGEQPTAPSRKDASPCPRENALWGHITFSVCDAWGFSTLELQSSPGVDPVAGEKPQWEQQKAFTGHFQHGSGLFLTWFRGYDPQTARWLQRDPLGESEGTNLYAYGAGNPISNVDPLGLNVTVADYLATQRAALSASYGNDAEGRAVAMQASGCQESGGALLTGLFLAVAVDLVLNFVPAGRIVAAAGPLHHIATNKNWIRGAQWSKQFAPLFGKAGMTLNDSLNKVRVLGHRGPHPDVYHQAVRQRLLQATRGLNGGAYAAAFRGELRSLAGDVSTPGHPLNSFLTQ